MSLPNGFKSASTTYTLNLDDLKVHFAAALNCKPEQISFTEIQESVASHPMDRYTSTRFGGLKITVKEL